MDGEQQLTAIESQFSKGALGDDLLPLVRVGGGLNLDK